MKILVIGGNGFLGSYLVDALLENQHEVRVYDRSHEYFRDPNSQVEYVLGDINDSVKLFESMMDSDAVFHLVSSTVPSSSSLDIRNDIEKNIYPTLSILESLVKLKIKKFIYFSSGGAVYGDTNHFPISEEHSLYPISSYGLSKVMIEKYIHLYANQYTFDPLVIRPSNPYGPRQGHHKAQGVISTFLRKSVKDEDFEIFGDGTNLKDYIFVEDLIKCIIELFENEKTGLYNIGSGEGASINQIVSIIDSVTGKKNKIRYTDSKNYDIKNFVLDISKVKKEVSHKTFKDLKSGISTTWDWING